MLYKTDARLLICPDGITLSAFIPDYLPTANQRVKQRGGNYLARTASHEQVEGSDQSYALRIILEWPSKEAAMNFMNDPQYTPHLEARTEGSERIHFVIEGKDDFAWSHRGDPNFGSVPYGIGAAVVGLPVFGARDAMARCRSCNQHGSPSHSAAAAMPMKPPDWRFQKRA